MSAHADASGPSFQNRNHSYTFIDLPFQNQAKL